MENGIAKALIGQFNLRVYEESVVRIVNMLQMLEPAEIWHKQNEQSNSIGNILLHLCGNVRQWICSGIGSDDDVRTRSEEFLSSYTYSAAELSDMLIGLKADTDRAFEGLGDENLLDTRTVQGFEETVLSIIVHVTEHFSYHTGQIATITKWLKNRDLEFYAGQDLDVVG